MDNLFLFFSFIFKIFLGLGITFTFFVLVYILSRLIMLGVIRTIKNEIELEVEKFLKNNLIEKKGWTLK